MIRTTQLNTFNNQSFNVGASRIKMMVWYLCNQLFFRSMIHSYQLKIFLLKIFGAQVGHNVIIKPHVNIKYPWKLIIGNDVWIGESVWIDNLDVVQIGNNVCISQGAFLLTGNHNYKKSSFDLMIGNIILEDGVWIGAKSIVGPNVICKSHSVLSVMSFANKNLEPYKIYRGNPAEIIKDRIVE
jgi:putative colanic acid biosynthesis acetyltransferase WcaF